MQIYDRGEAEGTYYIAMEYLEGRSLKEIIVKYAPLSPELLVSVAVQIVEALRFAHRRDVIHRDIKPQNIIIDNDGRVKVTDFGIARAGSASTMTEAGSILGTAHYFSPEQAQGQPVEAASDLYSLGVVMYEMATGRLPFDGDNPVSIAMQHVHDMPAPPRSINPEHPREPRGGHPAGAGQAARRPLSHRPGHARRSAAGPGGRAGGRAERLHRRGHPGHEPRGRGRGGRRAGPRSRRRCAGAPPIMPAPIIEPDEEPGRPRAVWPWVLVIILILALAGAAYVDPLQLEHRRGRTGGRARRRRAERGRRQGEDRGGRLQVREGGHPALRRRGRGRRGPPGPGAEHQAGQGQDRQRLDLVRRGQGRGARRGRDDQIEAAAKLGGLGLEVDHQARGQHRRSRSGTVLRQNPEAGKKVDAGHHGDHHRGGGQQHRQGARRSSG